jgi:hypothetical protein
MAAGNPTRRIGVLLTAADWSILFEALRRFAMENEAAGRGRRGGAVKNALKFDRNGRATLVAPGDIDAVHTVHMSSTGHRDGVAPRGRRLPLDRGAAGRPGASRRRRHDGPGVTRPPTRSRRHARCSRPRSTRSTPR